MISPSLKKEVTFFIFSHVVTKNPVFAQSEQLSAFVLRKIQLHMLLPEESIIKQGEQGLSFFFIAKGECNVYVKDEMKRERFVKTMSQGEHFGVIFNHEIQEVALLSG